MLLSEMHARGWGGSDMDHCSIAKGKWMKIFSQSLERNFFCRENFKILLLFINFADLIQSWCVSCAVRKWKSVEFVRKAWRLSEKSKCENFTPFQCRLHKKIFFSRIGNLKKLELKRSLGIMKLLVPLTVLLLVGTSVGFRGNSNRGSSSISSSQSNQLNIGLIAPHTNFGESRSSPVKKNFHVAMNYATAFECSNYVTIKYSSVGCLSSSSSPPFITQHSLPLTKFSFLLTSHRQTWIFACHQFGGYRAVEDTRAEVNIPQRLRI